MEDNKLTFRLEHSNPGSTTWTKLQQLAAFTSDGSNVIEHPISTVLKDEERLNQKDPAYYDDVFVGVHGENSHVYFSRVKGYRPEQNQLKLENFSSKIYTTTRYAFYNSPKLISLPSEGCLQDLGNGKTRVFLLPGEVAENVGYPFLKQELN